MASVAALRPCGHALRAVQVSGVLQASLVYSHCQQQQQQQRRMLRTKRSNSVNGVNDLVKAAISDALGFQA